MMDEIRDKLAGVIVEKRKPTNVIILWAFGANVLLWFFVPFNFIYHGYVSRLSSFMDRSPVIYTNIVLNLKDIAYSVELGTDEICWACSSAVVFSALLIVLLHRFTVGIIWFIITFVLMGSVGWMATAWYHYSQVEDFSIAWPITYTIITLILALIIYSIYKHVRIVIQLFEEGGKVAQSLPWILAQPFVTLMVLIITLTFAVLYFGLWCAATIDLIDKMGITQWRKAAWMLWAIFHNILMLFWIAKFFIGCQHVVIAGATATWYFTRDKTHVTDAITKNYKYLFKYHLGSVALGSFVLTTIRCMRVMYKTLGGLLFRIIFCRCLQMIYLALKCIEKCFTYLTEKAGIGKLDQSSSLRQFENYLYINRSAYIEIAIFGDGFFTSGIRARQVLTRNTTKRLIVHSVGDFVMVLGRFLITGLAVGVGYFLLHGKSDLKLISCPLVVIGIVSFVIAHLFISAFEMIVDSVLICFCEDCVMNDGEERPYYMSQEMMAFIKVDRRSKRINADAAEFQKKMSERHTARSFVY